MKFTSKNLAKVAVLAALSLIAFLIESLFPPLFIPGAKMGIGNLFVLFALIFYGVTPAIIILAVKILLGSLFTGNISVLMYSLPAGVISFSLEVLLLKCFNKYFSVLAVSVFAAVVHNSVQCIVFCLITAKQAIIYLPYLVLLAIPAGLVVGFTVYILSKVLPREILGFDR